MREALVAWAVPPLYGEDDHHAHHDPRRLTTNATIFGRPVIGRPDRRRIDRIAAAVDAARTSFGTLCRGIEAHAQVRVGAERVGPAAVN